MIPKGSCLWPSLIAITPAANKTVAWILVKPDSCNLPHPAHGRSSPAPFILLHVNSQKRSGEFPVLLRVSTFKGRKTLSSCSSAFLNKDLRS